MRSSLILFVLFLAAGCGPSARELREQTLSTLNLQADRWEGGKDFSTTAMDAYGRPVSCSVKKTTLNYVLEVRSAGPDGLPRNSDDIVVSRSERHGETSVAEEAGKAAKTITRGAVQGLKEEFRLGRGDKK